MDAELATTPPERSELDLVPAWRAWDRISEGRGGGIRKRAQVGEAAATEVEAP